ncbi:MAG TPA: SDR family oxidoreductase [Thermaerobacter sp.]
MPGGTDKRAGAPRVWLITGASRGLGYSVAARVAARGDALVICARDGEALGRAARRLAARGGAVEALAGDVSEPAFAARLVEAALRRFGRIDVLVNNASTLGPSPRPPLDEYPLEALARVYAVNVLAPLRLIQLVLPHFRRRRSGTIINVTSDAAVEGYAGWGGYGSSKAALELITRTLAAELAGTGIRVAAVDPGDMRTRMHQEAFPGEDISDRPPPEVAVPAILWLADHGPEPGCWRYRAQGWNPPAGDAVAAGGAGDAPPASGPGAGGGMQP